MVRKEDSLRNSSSPQDFAPPSEMCVMMMTLGVDPQVFASKWGRVRMSQAIRRCQDCATLDHCRKWLADPYRDPELYREFCANAGIFDQQVQQEDAQAQHDPADWRDPDQKS